METYSQSNNNQELSWRGDPSTNWSDWKVVIHNMGNDSAKEYNVHRNILAAGCRKCDYFSTLFGIQCAEQQDCCSRISLQSEEAAVFEIMLDFLYSSHAPNVNVNNVVALRNLARYFQCRELARCVAEFIQRNLTMGTAVLYLRNAFQRDDKLESAARNLICQHIHQIPVHSMDTLATELFRSIVCSDNIQQEHSKHVSIHVKSFFDVNPEQVSASLLHELTSHLTEIDVSVANGFLQLIAQLDPNVEDHSWLALDQLSRKCATALAPEWQTLDIHANGMEQFLNPSIEGDYRGTGRCIVPLLEASLEQAQNDYKRVQEELSQVQQENDTLKKKVHSMMGRVSAIETLGDRIRAMRRMDFGNDSISSSSTVSSIASSSSSSSSSSEELEVYTSGSDTSGSMDEW